MEPPDFHDLKSQIDSYMRKAMKDMIESTVTENMNEQQIDWTVQLLSELVNRINNLTPNRKDLQNALIRLIDIDLIKQMLEHDAIEKNDVIVLVTAVYDRLLMLCAPSQDEKIMTNRETCLEQPTTAKMVGYLLSTCDELINEIHSLLTNFKSSLTPIED